MTLQYFTTEEILNDIKETLENGYDSYLCDLHHEVFNTDYYIIGTCEAKKALTDYGVFEAIEEIQTYEINSFGEIFTEFGNPEQVANMLYYIKGEEVLNSIIDELEFNDYWNDKLTESTINNIIEYVEDELTRLSEYK